MARDQMTNRQKTMRELKPKVIPFKKTKFSDKFLSPKEQTFGTVPFKYAPR